MRVVFDVRNNLALLRKTDSYAQKQTANRQVKLLHLIINHRNDRYQLANNGHNVFLLC